VTKDGQTNDFTVSDHAAEIERFGGGDFLDAVLYNNQTPSDRILERYRAENAYLVNVDHEVLVGKSYNAIGGNFLGQIVEYNPSDQHLPVTRNLIRHNPVAVASALVSLVKKR
jgi:2-phospho-L-lactate transferase/gluconeogenesis factor (CofD/UPF0052 family)